MIRHRIASTSAALVITTAVTFAHADIKLAGMFGDHMVIQRGVACPIWGVANASTPIEVTLDGKPAGTATADAQGVFRVMLSKIDAAGGPHTIVVKSGADSATLSDVLAGDVWLCSGQSNMEFNVANANNRDAELATADRPTVRLFTVPRHPSAEVQHELSASWSTATPESVRTFSAVGYFFGRELNDKLNVPIGLIHSSWGGTPAEAWTPLAKLTTLTDLAEVSRMLARRELGVTPEAMKKYEEDEYAFLKATHRLDAGLDPKAAEWAKPELDAGDWKPLDTPGDWTAQHIPNGTMWFRKEIDVPPELAGQELSLSLGAVDDLDTTFFNGEQVGVTDWKLIGSYAVQRKYTVPATLVKAGRNVIAVRVYDSGGGAGLMGPANVMAAKIGTRSFPLAGQWLTKMESAQQPIDTPGIVPPTPPMQLDNPNAPSALYNGMIAPLADFPIKGAVWYQGESNAPRSAEYAKLLTAMIGAWREQFKVGDFPFYIVGLANFQAATDDPNAFTDWAPLREAQRQVGLTVKNAATTVTIDIGEAKDIHPKNKQDVGKRLALVALEQTYGQSFVSRGPTFKDATFDGAKVTIRFDHVGGGLRAIGEKLESFAVAGDDGKFAWADANIDANIDGDRVVLTAPGVPVPTRVRYAWADNPKASLFNAEGLPAEPFEARK